MTEHELTRRGGAAAEELASLSGLAVRPAFDFVLR
jgi:hypothetical protein